MELNLTGIKPIATRYDVIKAVEAVLHGPDLFDSNEQLRAKSRLPNFRVYLNTMGQDDAQLSGTVVVSRRMGKRLLQWLSSHAIDVLGLAIQVSLSPHKLSSMLRWTLEKTFYVGPDKERERQDVLQKLDHRLPLDKVQLGIWDVHRPNALAPALRAFSVEYELDHIKKSITYLKLDYDGKSIRIEYGYCNSKTLEYNIVIKFSSIRKIQTVIESGKAYIFIDMLIPPILERRITNSGDDNNRRPRKDRDRIPSLNIVHARVAPYAYHFRILLNNSEDIFRFKQLCRDAKGPRSERVAKMCVYWRDFFSGFQLSQIETWVKSMDWKNAFQVEALLRHGYLNPRELLYDLRGPIDHLCEKRGKNASEILRQLAVVLRARGPGDCSPLQYFEQVCADYESAETMTLPPGTFPCHHITFTPTRLILEGPYVTQSNRVIRHYQEHDPDLVENFIRVDFREENRTSFRWYGNVDATWFLQERVGGTLKNGFELAGRSFQFLAYSNSSLRDYSVWFMSPFEDPVEGRVTAGKIRDSLGDFSSVINQPSKYAARIAQAFTATDPSVKIRMDQWEEMPDLGPEKYLHTDGVGTVSPELADMIWEKLRDNRHDTSLNRVKPSAFQIRFLGYKGIVVVDDRLEGVKMRLRPSMRKFIVSGTQEADIEIARAFDRPNLSHLNRPIVMVLEDLGVRLDAFLALQERAKASVYTAMDSLVNLRSLLEENGLGSRFRLPFILEQLDRLGLGMKPTRVKMAIATPFLGRLVRYAMNHVLRDMKHHARIPVPNSYLLVGVADEGHAYINEGVDPDDVFTLKEGQIYACVQESPHHEPKWLKGSCVISRSPVVHPGDVRRVWAIGKPPERNICFFRNIRNVVVFPSTGDRSLASCLGGGDLDGISISDMYDVYAKESSLLPTTEVEPASYISGGTRVIETDSTVEDICDFVVEYFNSNPLLSDRHLVIAGKHICLPFDIVLIPILFLCSNQDQSRDGTQDPRCIALAELCSHAVDYPKNGIPVDLDKINLPRMLIPFKPDWKKAEISGPRDADFYESDRALGHMFRNVDLPDLKAPLNILTVPSNPRRPLSDPISVALAPLVQSTLKDQYIRPNGNSPMSAALFSRYARELQYIRMTHTLSDTPEVQLSEEEVVVGTIVANCSDNRWKNERRFRMQLHSGMLVKDIRRQLMTEESRADQADELDEGQLKAVLQNAWKAWDWSLRHAGKEGTNSFRLVVLGVLLDCLKTLGALPN
ncbi:hypothetical protein EW146_g7842 [Bondarzewia mesenterica]|uniref:RNA-dependent RNA polymerase n=1 Tax=Bondarzewia mesenterica TaxID=1095465 RepID=A0A4S4LJ97_9AGAM|nr:hypothetical protein EW146_g7842 [Bondarzewia mesenterica]